MSLMGLGLHLLCRITSMSGRMEVLGSLLTNLRNAGGVVGGVILTVLVQIMMIRLVGVSALFLGLSNLFRELMWGVILALQSSSAVHLGVDNLGVVRHVGRLLDGHNGSTPF